MCAAPPLSVVVITYNRREELLRTLGHLSALPEAPPLIVVDNHSTDDTPAAVRARFPAVTLLAAGVNLGAAGRNLGVRRAQTRYVAFCDDDTWWEPGALRRAAELLDAHPRVAVLTGRVLVGVQRREDPICQVLARSPVPSPPDLPGVPLVGFLAGASVVRRSAFLAAGGFDPRIFLGGEEGLLAVDLLASGWHLRYVPELMVIHDPSRRRDKATRGWCLARNELWLAWLRRPLSIAVRRTWALALSATRDDIARRALIAACRGLPWVLAERRLPPSEVERQLRLVESLSVS